MSKPEDSSDHGRRPAVTIQPRGRSTCVRFRACGKRVRRSFRTPEEAERFADRVRNCRSQREMLWIAHETDRLHEWFENWLKEGATVSLTPVGAEFYIGEYTRHIEPVLGSVRLRDLPDQLQPWANDLSRPGSQRRVGEPTAHKTFSALKSILRFAVLQQALKSNPMDDVTFPTYRRPAPHLRPAPTPEFVELILWLLGRDDDRLLVQLMFDCGLRPGEGLGVRPALIRLRPEVLMLNVSIVRGE